MDSWIYSTPIILAIVLSCHRIDKISMDFVALLSLNNIFQ